MVRVIRWRDLIWVLPALLILSVFVLAPLVQNFFFSFVKWDIYSGTREFAGLANYSKMFNDPIFWRALVNNVAYAVISVIVQVFGALVLAASIEGLRHERIKRTLRALYFIPAAMSITVAGLLFYFIYEPNFGFLNVLLERIGLGQLQQAWLGQANTAMGSIIAMSQWQAFGYTTFLFSIAIQRIPTELYESALLDGVNAYHRLFKITMPLVREMTTLLIIVTISGAFQVFNEVMVMTSGGPNDSSQVLVTWLYQSGFIKNDFGYAAAVAVVIFIVTLVLAVSQLAVARRRKVEW